jgi:hypothetical protein
MAKFRQKYRYPGVTPPLLCNGVRFEGVTVTKGSSEISITLR